MLESVPTINADTQEEKKFEPRAHEQNKKTPKKAKTKKKRKKKLIKENTPFAAK